MRETLLNFVRNFSEGVKEEFSWYRSERGSKVYMIDYKEEMQNELDDQGIEYTEEEIENMYKLFEEEMKKEYGEDNVYYGSNEHVLPVDGRFVTINNQMGIVYMKEEEVND